MARIPRRLISALAIGLLAPALAVAPPTPSATAATVPEGFSDALVESVAGPTALAFTADGRMLITTQGGDLLVRTAAGTLLPTPALDLSSRLCSNSERGLLGIAVDPDPATRAIYLFYTARGAGGGCPTSSSGTPDGAPHNRVSRFVLGDDNRVDPASETVLLDGIVSTAGNHNAGDLHVGKDGYLYVTTGDGGCDYAGDSSCGGGNNAARDRHVLLGKVLRVDRTTGEPAPGNPFTGPGTASCRLGPTTPGTTCQETFAWGLRNPFRFAFDPDAAGTVFHVNDVGQDTWEEIDLGIAGADYGWNRREGHCEVFTSEQACGSPTPAGLTDPLYDYGHSTGCRSITGGAFVPDGAWPARFDDGYLFADYVCGKIMMLSDGVRTDVATGLGGAVHLEFGPHDGGQALYYTTYAGGGEIRRLAYEGSGNRTPTAALTAAPTSGAAPLAVTLDGSGSTDPDGDALTYLWSFGDGTPDATTTTPTVTHTYDSGTWTATLRVRDPDGATSAAATVTIHAGNSAPVVTMTGPAEGARFVVGQEIDLDATATDPEDGTLPPSALTWTVVRVHDEHTHPFLGPVSGDDVSLVAPGPEDLVAAGTSHLRVSVTATDSGGVSTTVTRDVLPETVEVTLTTTPSGRTLVVEGEAMTTPVTFPMWVGAPLRLAVPYQTDDQGRPYGLDAWSDGSTSAERTWVTPASDATLAAALSLRSPEFADVGPGQPFYADIRWLADEGLTAGTRVGDQTWFEPTTPTSRQAMAAFLYRYAGDGWTPAPGTHTFADVPPGHPFHVAVEWMAESGVAGGYDDGTFGATRPVSRQAMAAFLHRLAGEPEPTGRATFSDVTAANPFAGAIAWLEEAGIAEGYDDGSFGITRPVSRQAMAAFLHRYDGVAG